MKNSTLNYNEDKLRDYVLSIGKVKQGIELTILRLPQFQWDTSF